MTFFNQQQRNQRHNTTQNSLIGPGKYSPQPLYNSRHHSSYAPFGTLSAKSPKKSEQLNIGPGQYDISKPIIKPSIKRYENDNIIIIKINYDGGHPFKSRTNRFKYTLDQSQVGPGSYELQNSVRRRVRSNTVDPKPQAFNKVRQINHEYLLKLKPSLLSDPPQEHHPSSKSEASHAKGVVRWSLNRKERFDLLVKEQQSDQHKNEQKANVNNKLKKPQPSAVFASKSIKSHLETQIYKTSNPFKADLRKMINYKDQQPGPGSYQIKSANKYKALPKFQYFGSSVERFPSEPSESNVGPGCYQIQGRYKKQEQRQNLPISEERHSYLPKKDFIPGPGAYQIKNVSSPLSDKKYQQPAFGSQQPRFDSTVEQPEHLQQNELAINRYFRQREQKRLQDLRVLKRVVEDHPSAVFTSNTKRFNQQHPNPIEIGQYDTTQNDINARLAKQQKLIQQLQECQLHKPPFLSSDQRFKQIKLHESQHKNCWCQVKNVEKQMLDHQSPVFISTEKRTTVFQSSPVAPPVGYYPTKQNSIIKDSFNSRFRKRNHNQIKKDLAFKIKPMSRLQTQPLSRIPQGLQISP